MALVEASVEGTIDSIDTDNNGGAIMTTMTAGAKRVTILYSPGNVITVPQVATGTKVRQKSIRTPSQRLSVSQLISKVPLPGRGAIEGFEGGTIIADGYYDTQAGRNVLLANHLAVEPGETVLIGAVTGNDGTKVSINTVDIAPLTDSRLSTNPAAPGTPVFLNDSGFEITLASILPDPTTAQVPGAAPLPATAAEGYFANGQFHAFLIEYGQPGLLASLPDAALPIDYPRISIERAQVRVEANGFEIEIRGSLSAPPPLSAGNHVLEFRVRDMKVGTFGTLDSNWEYRQSEDASNITNMVDEGEIRVDQVSAGGAPITLIPPTQRWRFRGILPKSGLHSLPPERFEVRNVTAELFFDNAGLPNRTVRAEADTDVRDA